MTHVSTADLAGGAERVALTIHLGCLKGGVDSTLAVGFKFLDLPRTVLIPNDRDRGLWARSLRALAPEVPAPPSRLSSRERMIRRAVNALAEPARAWNIYQGLDDNEFPGTRSIRCLSERSPDVLQLHNLHGGYFDLRELPGLCALQPTVLTVHDAWLASGHCAYSVDCDAWLSGCGECPHPEFPPSILRDRTRENWLLKKSVFADSRTQLHLVSPSQWALDRMNQSIVAPAIQSGRVIANGIDTDVFGPGDKKAARDALGIETDSLVFTFTAAGSSPYKDPATIEAAVVMLMQELACRTDSRHSESQSPLVLLMLGSSEQGDEIQGLRIIRVPFLQAARDVARCLQASDVYLHAARAEVFPLGILEAQSCGLPAIVTRTGGAPECISEGETGFVVAQSDPSEMAAAAKRLALDPVLRQRMGAAARVRAELLFSVETMTSQYIDLYKSLLEEETSSS